MPTPNESSPEFLPTADRHDAAVCCQGWRTLRFAALGGCIAVIGALAFFAGRTSRAPSHDAIGRLNLPLIDATAAVASDNYSIATGQVSERSEGLFVLDHNSGLLQCQVLYSRVGQFLGSFSVNVADVLGNAGKGGKYLMVTGGASFQGAGNQAFAPTVVYILDTATGNYVCYAVPFDRVAENARRPQQNTMHLIGRGVANAIPDRDQLR